MFTLRFATPEDAPAILAVYAPYIENTPVTFEYAVPSEREFAARIEQTTRRFPWLICEEDGKPAGYVYAGEFKQRAAFQWDAEVSAYFAPEYHGKGLGKAMYACVLELLRSMGLCNVYALICVPNAQSIGFHRAMGFEQTFVYERTGFKLGRWLDLAVLRCLLRPLPSSPAPTLSLWELPQGEVKALLACTQAEMNI